MLSDKYIVYINFVFKNIFLHGVMRYLISSLTLQI